MSLTYCVKQGVAIKQPTENNLWVNASKYGEKYELTKHRAKYGFILIY